MKSFSLAALLVATLLGCSSGKVAREDRNEARLERAGNPPGISVSLCGSVATYVPATDAATGRLAIERRAWTIAKGTSIVDDDLLSPGTDVCIDAELDTSRTIVSCVVSAPRDPGWPDD